MRLIDVDAFKADYRMADECKDCTTPVRACEYDRVYTKMDFCSWLDDAPTIVPSVQPQDIARVMLNQHWILVSERLPDEWKRVLIQNDEGLFLVGFVKDSGCGKEWYYQYEMYDYDAYVESEQGKIVAWCELPEPWKGDQ